ncbi:MAG: helix-turn-helix domain-containing protein, partial [Candidatus Obscuribacterales bacterium]|nr:helix-turn-helix domain-containing protein [Candidatus Obscuribacterales bacterium]
HGSVKLDHTKRTNVSHIVSCKRMRKMSVILTDPQTATIIIIMPIDQLTLYSRIGKRLQKRRAQLGITQVELSQRIKMSRTSIANIEAGNQNAPIHIIYDLCIALDISPIDIFPTIEDVTSSIEVGEQIAAEMTQEKQSKAAMIVRNLVRSSTARGKTGGSKK